MFWPLFLIDVIWNGAFVDWFVRSYMIEDQYTCLTELGWNVLHSLGQT